MTCAHTIFMTGNSSWKVKFTLNASLIPSRDEIQLNDTFQLRVNNFCTEVVQCNAPPWGVVYDILKPGYIAYYIIKFF